jgi:RNA polymerase sigma-70 factor, ECF subfamily
MSDPPAGADPSKPRPGPSREELVLVERLLAGDESVFRGLVDRYHGRLQRLALVFLSSPATAEEVVQETWLAVLGGLPSFERRSSLQTWIFRILTNRAKTRAIRDGRLLTFSALQHRELEEEHAVDPNRFTTQGTWAEPPFPWNEDTPELLLQRKEAMAHLQKALGGLPATQRAVVTLRDVEGMDSEDVCNILEISENHQRVLLHRARSKLRRALEQYVEGR